MVIIIFKKKICIILGLILILISILSFLIFSIIELNKEELQIENVTSISPDNLIFIPFLKFLTFGAFLAGFVLILIGLHLPD